MFVDETMASATVFVHHLLSRFKKPFRVAKHELRPVFMHIVRATSGVCFVHTFEVESQTSPIRDERKYRFIFVASWSLKTQPSAFFPCTVLFNSRFAFVRCVMQFISKWTNRTPKEIEEYSVNPLATVDAYRRLEILRLWYWERL